jgi:hypothetical protein
MHWVGEKEDSIQKGNHWSSNTVDWLSIEYIASSHHIWGHQIDFCVWKYQEGWVWGNERYGFPWGV